MKLMCEILSLLSRLPSFVVTSRRFFQRDQPVIRDNYWILHCHCLPYNVRWSSVSRSSHSLLSLQTLKSHCLFLTNADTNIYGRMVSRSRRRWRLAPPSTSTCWWPGQRGNSTTRTSFHCNWVRTCRVEIKKLSEFCWEEKRVQSDPVSLSHSHMRLRFHLGTPFPKNFQQVVKVIFKKLFRVYAHIYHSHFQKIVGLGAEAHLNTCFKHFIYFGKIFLYQCFHSFFLT